MFQLANSYFIQHKEQIGSYTCPLAVTPPSWSRFLSGWHCCHPKNQSFILRVRKYELRVVEPFILCRILAAYYFTLPMYGNYNSFTKHLFGSHVKKAGPSASGTQQQFYEVGDKLMDSHCFLLFFAISSKLLKKLCQFCAAGAKSSAF